MNGVEEEEPSPSITTENDRCGGGLGYWPAWQNETTLSTNGRGEIVVVDGKRYGGG